MINQQNKKSLWKASKRYNVHVSQYNDGGIVKIYHTGKVLKWLGNIVEGWRKKLLNFCIKCYLLYSFYYTNPLTCKKSWKNSQTTKISMVFLKASMYDTL